MPPELLAALLHTNRRAWNLPRPSESTLTALITPVNWCPEWGSNPHWEDFKQLILEECPFPGHRPAGSNLLLVPT